MEVLYKKVFEKFSTLFYQDYLDIPTKKSSEIEDPFDEGNTISELVHIEHASEKYPHFKFLRQSDDPKDFNDNYGNPLCGVFVNRLTLVVEKNQDKISLKIFFYYKHRKRGNVYFEKTTKMNFVTYSFKTNDLYNGKLINGFKKRKRTSSIKKNYFAAKPIEMFILSFKNNVRSYIKEKENHLIINYNKIIYSAVETFMKEVVNEETARLQWDVRLYLHYLQTRNIKYPNNFVTFMSLIPLPNKRKLKKAQYKLVDAVMLQNGLSGDKIKKILHKTNSVNLDFYKKVEKFFGQSFLRHVDEETLTKIITYKNGHMFPSTVERFSKKEKQNIFEIFKYTLTGEIHYWSFIDHLNFYDKISEFEELKWKSNNISSFNKEHSEWTDKYQHYTHGSFFRFYSEKFMNGFVEPFEDNGKKYYPVVLTSSAEYNNESAVQSNCVKTYIDKAGSIIISLRVDSPDSEERVTVEFRIGIGWFDNILLRRRQTLARFNRNLDKSWDKVITMLDKRVIELTEFFELPKVKVEFGGGTVESDSQFDEKRKYVDWVSPYITKIRPFEDNFIIDNLDLDLELGF